VYRFGGVAREPRLLETPELAGVWDVFDCPYLAHAEAPGEVALPMADLSPHLFPDEREPLPLEAEDALLGALAALHARFWESPALELSWLTSALACGTVLGPGAGAEDARRATPHPMFARVEAGWRSALALDAGGERAEAEWTRWVEALARRCG
jgi:hypothetical protein